jgi:hypothetical protein
MAAASAPQESADFETQMTVTPWREGLRDGFADAAAGAGDECGAIGEGEHEGGKVSG